MYHKDNGRVYPTHRDKFYVYLLSKPNGTPFYVGKGKGGRVNDHFKPSSLTGNSPKIQTIKKYGSDCKRDIIAYFDSEEAAYEHEEWLIGHYGTFSTGGLLTNYALNRFDYIPEHKLNAAKGALGRKDKYSETKVLSAYRLYFTELLPSSEVASLTGIPAHYLSYLMDGSKQKRWYFKYISSGVICTKARKGLGMIQPVSVLHETVYGVLYSYYINQVHIHTICTDVGHSEAVVRGWVQGKKRPNVHTKFFHDHTQAKRLIVRVGGDRPSRLKELVRLVAEGVPINEASALSGVPKTTARRYITNRSLNVS